jgi:hypothetical protein
MRAMYNRPGSGISGRPILHELQPGVRHLAYQHEDAWYTWCGLRVPEDHRCPSETELNRPHVWGVPKNCPDCFRRYTRHDPVAMPGVPAPRYSYECR